VQGKFFGKKYFLEESMDRLKKMDLNNILVTCKSEFVNEIATNSPIINE
jgi:hypothetical protein